MKAYQNMPWLSPFWVQKAITKYFFLFAVVFNRPKFLQTIQSLQIDKALETRIQHQGASLDIFAVFQGMDS